MRFETAAFFVTTQCLLVRQHYEISDPLPPVKTKIQYWYGSKEKKDRKRDIAWVRKSFSEAEIIENQGYEHAQLVIVHPEEFAHRAFPFYFRDDNMAA